MAGNLDKPLIEKAYSKLLIINETKANMSSMKQLWVAVAMQQIRYVFEPGYSILLQRETMYLNLLMLYSYDIYIAYCSPTATMNTKIFLVLNKPVELK